MANPQFKIVKGTDYIDIYVPITSQGKFRCKTRRNFKEYGKGFAPKSNIIPTDAYMEWQIGYDKVIGDENKETSLDNLVFIGANGKKKSPYELSEILYLLCKLNLISKEEIDDLINTIGNMHNFLQDMYEIQLKSERKIKINNQKFYKSSITLPTFNRVNKNSEIVTQISIKNQQYAAGVQPMLYVTIPVTEFENSDRLIGRTSADEEFGILRVNKDKTDIFKNIFLCFGMCSDAHHHDTMEILKLISDNI